MGCAQLTPLLFTKTWILLSRELRVLASALHPDAVVRSASIGMQDPSLILFKVFL